MKLWLDDVSKTDGGGLSSVHWEFERFRALPWTLPFAEAESSKGARPLSYRHQPKQAVQ